jgi:hypothetical protein
MKKKLLYFSPLLIAALLLPACNNTVRGGGWIEMPPNAQGVVRKATFGFQLVCDQITNEISGSISYKDHSDNIKFFGNADGGPVCNDQGSGDPMTSEFEGDYTPQPKTAGPGGRFRVILKDEGEPGASEGDSITVELNGGVYSGYNASGIVRGGNIQVEQ